VVSKHGSTLRLDGWNVIVMHACRSYAFVIVDMVIMYIDGVIVYVILYDADVLDDIEQKMQTIRARLYH